MKMKRSGILILAAIMAAQTVGCASGAAVDTTAADTSAAESESVTERVFTEIEAKDYGGYEFRVITQQNDGQNYNKWEIFSEGENGDIINDNVYGRNRFLEEKYGIKIVGIDRHSFSGEIRKAVMADEDIFDLALHQVSESFISAMNGYLVEVSEIPHLELDAPWWNQTILEETSVADNRYLMLGAMNILAYDSIGALFFNKELLEDKGVTELYDVVREGKWTLDRMLTYCSDFAADINGDTVMDDFDQYGMAVSSYSALTLTNGGGLYFTKKDENDIPTVSLNERSVEYWQKLAGLISQEYVMYGGGYGATRVAEMQAAFEENRLMFYNELLNRTSLLRSMEKDFGILPMPKMNEAQENYSSFVHNGNSSVASVPITNTDLDRTGRILEDMARYSDEHIYPAYVETAIKGKFLRDEDSAEMVDILIENIHFDIAIISGCGMETLLRKLIGEGSPDIVSQFEANASAYNEKLAKMAAVVTGE